MARELGLGETLVSRSRVAPTRTRRETRREALLLVGAARFSYEEAAGICESAWDDKSRVNRARKRLSELLAIDSAGQFGLDHATRAVLTAGGRG